MSNNRAASLFIVWSFLHLLLWAFAEHLPAAPRYFSIHSLEAFFARMI